MTKKGHSLLAATGNPAFISRPHGVRLLQNAAEGQLWKELRQMRQMEWVRQRVTVIALKNMYSPCDTFRTS